MKSKLLCLLVLLTCYVHAAEKSAEPLKLSDGRTFAAWTITAETAGTVTIHHKGGMAKVSKKLLPAELAREHPYNSDGVKAEEEAASAKRIQGARAGKLAAAEWKQVFFLKGNGPQRTRDFVVAKDTWRVIQTMNPTATSRAPGFTPYAVVKAYGTEEFLVGSMDKAGSTTSYGKKAGTFYLLITSADAEWSVTVEELK